MATAVLSATYKALYSPNHSLTRYSLHQSIFTTTLGLDIHYPLPCLYIRWVDPPLHPPLLLLCAFTSSAHPSSSLAPWPSHHGCYHHGAAIHKGKLGEGCEEKAAGA